MQPLSSPSAFSSQRHRATKRAQQQVDHPQSLTVKTAYNFLYFICILNLNFKYGLDSDILVLI